jgi:hypothetical protein
MVARRSAGFLRRSNQPFQLSFNPVLIFTVENVQTHDNVRVTIMAVLTTRAYRRRPRATGRPCRNGGG